MKSLQRFRFIAAILLLLLTVQVLAPGRSAAAGKVIEQLPEPEWSYTLPEGITFWGTIDSLQSKGRMFIPLVKTVTVSATQKKSSGMLYASVDRVNGSANWVYDYSDMANDKPFTAHHFYTTSSGYSYFYKNRGGVPYDLTAVDPNGKLKWTKYITGSYSPVVLDNGNIVIRTLVNMNKASLDITEYNQEGKQLRKLKLTNKWAKGWLEVFPNGYIAHTITNDKDNISSISVYRGLGALTTPLATYTVPQSLINPYLVVKPLSGGSFLIQMDSTNSRVLIGYDANGKKKWVRTLNKGDQIDTTGNNYLVRNDNVYRLYSKDNQLLGKQQIGETGDNDWNFRITPSGEITVENQYQWQERPADIDPETFEGDRAREDFYVLDPGNLQIKHHLSTLWLDYEAGHNYIYAGNGELYLTRGYAPKTISKYLLK
ncbi:hypothetical protein [Paenibacillus sp. MMS20-IR301]|uniref:hypothetical protein n=1 Tax=Paenibacillus sp. MMS20-IR301 TaxID=2895946 RepID=UPI0028ED94F2|nr:hypothetical protein [Paenibacillus sp. MMS20-IR301]WNS45558.1 hypothetical protein LOS79_09900 [Paenibacillus sp. MMS20-IR301]